MHNDCRETQAEMVRDKQGRNRCEWFRLTDREAAAGGVPDRSTEARARLERLFAPPREKRDESRE
jgi:hypothetical protein